jgi:Protein of unknown function, DUF547
MTKCFIILLCLLAVVCGCSTGPQEPATAVTVPVEPRHVAEPTAAEPNETKPAGVQPPESKAAEVKPVAEPNSLKRDSATLFHDKCAEIFRKFVDARGMVDYKELRRKRLDLRSVLDQYDNPDRKVYESWSKADKIAFWINVYNLQKLSVVTDNYPIEPSSRILMLYWGPNSIRHIEARIARHKFLVMDEEFTFARIEKHFFRGEFDDPRVFFALSSACLSSPPVRNEPYYGRTLNEQLDDQVRRFLSSPLAFRIDREEHKVYLSALFQQSWYGNQFAEKFAIDRKFKEFPAATRAVLNFITHYVSKQDVSFLEVGNYTIEYMTFDWTINDGS